MVLGTERESEGGPGLGGSQHCGLVARGRRPRGGVESGVQRGLGWWMDMFGDRSILTVFALGTPCDSTGCAESMASVAGVREQEVSRSVNLVGS